MRWLPAASIRLSRSTVTVFLGLWLLLPVRATAAEVTVKLKNLPDVRAVGAIQRWDKDGTVRRAVDPKAAIDAVVVEARATAKASGQWVFKSLPAGQYDLVILGKDHFRLEGFQFAPVKEFDRFLSAEATVEPETRDAIAKLIAQAPHFENRVEPLHMAGDDKTVRVLVALIRDKPTSYERDFPGAATIRHEIWEFTWNYGGWQKEKRTQVLDRVMLHRDELHKWTWLWDPKLGGIEVRDKPVTVTYEFNKNTL